MDNTVICHCECFKWYCQKTLKEILWSTDSTKQIRQLTGVPLSKCFTKNYKLQLFAIRWIMQHYCLPLNHSCLPRQDMRTPSKLLGGVMTTLFSVKLYHHHLLLNNLLTWACVNFSGLVWTIEAGRENLLIWSKHKKLAPKRISAANPNNALINLLNYIIYYMVLSCHDNPKSIASFHGLRLRSHQIQCCGEKRCVFH